MHYYQRCLHLCLCRLHFLVPRAVEEVGVQTDKQTHDAAEDAQAEHDPTCDLETEGTKGKVIEGHH